MLEVFNPAFFDCWIIEYPVDCHINPPCVRGANASRIYVWVFYYVPIWIPIAVNLYSMTNLYATVRAQDVKAEKWRMRSTGGEKTSLSSSSTTTQRQRPSFNDGNHKIVDDVPQQQEREEVPPGGQITASRTSTERRQQQIEKYKLSRGVAVQGIWYMMPFLVTWIFPTATTVVQVSFGSLDWMYFVSAGFVPLQGFLNWMAYLRPLVLEERKKEGQQENQNDLEGFAAFAAPLFRVILKMS